MNQWIFVDNPDDLLRQVESKYKYSARRFAEYLRANQYDLGDPVAWQFYLKSLALLKASTYNVRLAAMKMLIREAVKSSCLNAVQKQTVENTLAGLHGKEKPESSQAIREKALSPAEIQQLIEAAKLPDWGLPHRGGAPRFPRIDVSLWVEFLWYVAPKVSEMTRIRLDDIAQSGDHYRVLIKGRKKDRYVGAPSAVIDRVLAHFKGNEFLFQSRNRGKGTEADYRYSRT